ncbi:hypothetical protein A1O3_02789 [Capronia epimyces CBS 606.96]|uniref:T6SS Phospholipase effector Tle1-like catalytic domain-containing protein n=1 Tax=Capronia epimyces CBS 606.96 TaxID=1182542 RepID=W9YA33_9EURO|nr:uncharacterized protein A1O3_02789 [Capronia epimyces CBS 606.96]EXJ89722.1 hypothetical protein A1O3_02789 [Capronia epimyces CBS 606.96]
MAPSTATPKRLIVLCDGTWQNSLSGEAFSYPTNVTRFSRALSQFGDRDGQKVPQIIYYQPGVGTGNLTDKLTGVGVYGAGVSADVRAAYGFLAHNFNPGDQIYFFGYSRGAYTARAVAGLVTTLGLLTKKGMDRFGAVYQEYYRKENKGSKPDIQKLEQLAGGELHEGAKDSVEIIGVWDTVGFHGAGFGGEEFEFYNTTLSPRVKHGLHALSLDETREAFLPTLWDSRIDSSDSAAGGGNVKQVWFCGTHAIGGGDKDSTLADIALGWMVAECHKTETLSFVDIDGSAASSYLLSGPAAVGGPGSKPHQPLTPWPTVEYPEPAAASSTAWGVSNLVHSVPGTFWTVANWILPAKSGVRTPNSQGFVPAQTNERIHQSIRDRRLGEWPCRPIAERIGESTRWKLAPPAPEGAVLEETDPDAVELRFKGKIRPVA